MEGTRGGWPPSDGVEVDRVLLLFRTSLDEGVLPTQWRNAKIIPLKKPNKGDYTAGKAWRPISLLSTLGKVLESVVAERISHAVETSGCCLQIILEHGRSAPLSRHFYYCRSIFTTRGDLGRCLAWSASM
jgi:hypothetical protein